MTSGRVVTFFSPADYDLQADGPFRTVELRINGQVVFTYIHFDQGKAGVVAHPEQHGTKNPLLTTELWWTSKGIPQKLMMEFFLMCFEAKRPDGKSGFPDKVRGEIYEW